MESITLKSLLTGSSVRLGLTGGKANNCLIRSVNRVVHLREAGCHLFSERAWMTIFVVSPSLFPIINGSTGERKTEFMAMSKAANVACLAVPRTTNLLPYSPSRCLSKLATPVISSSFDEFLLASRLMGLLRERLHHRIFVHGALVNVYGLGILIMGDSGCGKTTYALELAAHGHKWIADDTVEIKKCDDNILYGRSHARSQGLLEIKGRGIIPASDILPGVAIGAQSPLDLIVEIKRSDESVPVSSRLTYRKIMDVRLPVLRFSRLSPEYWRTELERRTRLMRRMGIRYG